MKTAILLLVPLLAGCGRSDSVDRVDRNESDREAAPVQVADLTGLYEARGEGGQRGRMCMISNAGVTSFGIVTEGPGGSCGGAGKAVREGGRLRLTMGGDEACVIEAPMTGAQVTLPASLPAGCAYYCAPGATLAGMTFEKSGGTAEDAMRATDLAGDPLCG